MTQTHNPPPAGPVTFEDLYAKHAGRVLSFLWHFGVTSEAAREDVSQEVWADVHRLLPLFDPSRGSARAWLAAITRSAARDWKRTRKRRPELSTPTDREPITPRTAEMDAQDAERRAALWAYFERAVPNEDQREAFLLHVIEGLTVEEVAEATGTYECTVKWRIARARRMLKEKMTEEERRKLHAILPVLSVDAFVRALRDTAPPVTDDQVARVWDRVVEHIEARGGSIHDPLGTPATTPSPQAPKDDTFTGPGLASALAAMFLLGAFAGALAHALLSSPSKASMTIHADIPPAPPLTAEPIPEPKPTASAAPSMSSSPPRIPAKSEAWILERARKAEPAEALALADEHAQSFPSSSRAAGREVLAIHALVQLGRRAEAEARAVKLVRWAPTKRPEMEALFGRSLL